MPAVTSPWIDPADVFRRVSRIGGDMVFYYSSGQTSYSGRYSLLAWDPTDSLVTHDWDEIDSFLSRIPDGEKAFGYIGYEMLHGLEEVPSSHRPPISTPAAQLRRFRYFLRFDHELNQIDGTAEVEGLIDNVRPAKFKSPRVRTLAANMTRSEYLQRAQETIDAIRDGALYQANLTRKWSGAFERPADGPALFLKLQAASPAPYGAYLRLGEMEILSSSPEMFLQLSADGSVISRPIKGTLSRSGTNDDGEREALMQSAKDRAENLMIVDLMRNDLAKVTLPSSVSAHRLFDIDSFKTIHHLSSVVAAKLSRNYSSVDLVRAAFPPGSMTGAPKIAAMKWIAQQERLQRGVYSGALGWMTRNSCELSVVIRTLILNKERFEFQTGGGIVADSDPHLEWQELLDKARGIAVALGLSESQLS